MDGVDDFLGEVKGSLGMCTPWAPTDMGSRRDNGLASKEVDESFLCPCMKVYEVVSMMIAFGRLKTSLVTGGTKKVLLYVCEPKGNVLTG